MVLRWHLARSYINEGLNSTSSVKPQLVSVAILFSGFPSQIHLDLTSDLFVFDLLMPDPFCDCMADTGMVFPCVLLQTIRGIF